jgi:hypothetical protein
VNHFATLPALLKIKIELGSVIHVRYSQTKVDSEESE